MAHRGRPWPLAFRRDFNLNVLTYNRGLPDSWDVNWWPAFQPPGPGPGRIFISCPYQGEASENHLYWLCPYTLTDWGTYQIRLDFEVTGDPAGMSSQLSLFENTLGLVLVLRLGIDGRQQSMPPFQTPGGILFFNNSWAGSFPFPLQPGITATPYP
jgi:hypothetical protein